MAAESNPAAGGLRGSKLTAALCTALTLLASAALAYHPRCNVVRAIYIHASDIVPAGAWVPWSTPGRYVTDTAHSGKFSMFCQYDGGPGGGCGVGQTVEINQAEARPIKIAGWSKAENVQAEEKSWRYSLYVDFVLADGKPWMMKVAAFSPGTHDWEYAETVVTPPKPIRSARFYAFIREIGGKVWFDDLFLGEPGGKNLLRCPGFEPQGREDTSQREAIFRRYKELHANGMHVYLSHTRPYWPSRIVQSPYSEDGRSPLETFLRDARRRGIGVWTTPAAPHYRIKSVNDPNFPAYYCPNSRWGQDWNAILADLARFDFAGISLVPDEYNYNNWRLKQRFAKHGDPKVAEFYKKMPNYCDCPDCRRLFRKMFGMDLPADMNRMRPDEAHRCYLNFRYWTTTRWLKAAAETVKRVNPNCLADSLICVTPVCSDNWWGPGVAWDMVGYRTRIDYLTTDPYILLHNYLGDSTHWYVTETALKLAGAAPRHVCGVVLEPCRLRKEFRELDPVEVYGSPLSAVFHGAREVFYFHWVHITGRSGVAADPAATQRNVAAAYALLEAIDPWLDGAKSWPGVAVLHSRASEDWWAFYCSGDEGKPMLTWPDRNSRFGFLSQLEPLMALLRAGIPADLFYLDAVRAEQLRPYPVLLVPFPYAVPDGAAKLLEDLARSGKRVVVVYECGRLTQDGLRRPQPALLKLLGLTDAPRGQKTGRLDGIAGTGDEQFTIFENVRPAAGVRVLARVDGTPALIERRVGRGSVLFMAGEFGAGLPQDYSNWHKGRDQRVFPPVLRPGHFRVLLTALFSQPHPPADWPAVDPVPVPGAGDDVEVAYMLNRRGDLLVLAINWRADPAEVAVRVPQRWVARPYNVRRIEPPGKLAVGARDRRSIWDEHGRLALTLEPQEVAVVRILRPQ